jgi:hypothetical protein
VDAEPTGFNEPEDFFDADNGFDRFLDVRALQLTLPVRQLFQQINAGSIGVIADSSGRGFHGWTLMKVYTGICHLSMADFRSALMDYS